MISRIALGLWHVGLRAVYRLIYGPLNGIYDLAAAAASGGQWQEWQAATLPHLCGPRVLEIACGPGYLLARIRAYGYTAVGVDRSPQMTRRARNRSGAPVALADARSLPFRSGAFSAVVMTFSGLTTDPDVLAEAWRVLAPDGWLVALDEVTLRGRTWHTLVARGVLQATSAGIVWPARERMEAAGFRVTVKRERVGESEAQVLVGVRGNDA